MTPWKRPAGLLALSLGVHLLVATLPDDMGDISVYRAWMKNLSMQGLSFAYWPPPVPRDLARPPIDYPPVLPFLLWGMGWTLFVIAPGWPRWPGPVLDLALRVPLVLATLAIGLLVFATIRRRAGPREALAACAVFVLSPAVLFDVAYWGQSDSLSTLLLVAGLLLTPSRPIWGLATLAVGTQVKPLIYPFLPLAALWVARRHGPGKAVLAAAAAFGAWSALLVPFALAGRLGDILKTLYYLLDAMPFASVNAHNLWWIVGRGVPWIPAWKPALGPFTYEDVGLGLFGTFYAGTLLALWRSSSERALLIASASVAFGFFELVTHMHENHLFAFLPLALLAFGEQKRWRSFVLVVGVFCFANMALHDPALRYSVGRVTPGPRVTLPPQPDQTEEFVAELLELGFQKAAEAQRGRTTVLRLVVTLVNAQVGLLLLAYWLAHVRLGRGWNGVPPARAPGVVSPWMVTAGLLLAASGVPFLVKLVHVATRG